MNRTMVMAMLATVFLFSSGTLPSAAAEFEGVTMPEARDIGGKSCALVGMGLRTKFIVKVYVAGLYMEKPSREAAEVVAADMPKGIFIQAIGPTMGAEKVKGALEDGFGANTPSPSPDLKERMAAVKALFTDDVKKGDTFDFVYVPGEGTTVSVNGAAKGTVPGDDLMRAVFAVWFGEKPADKGLKKGVLGK